MQRLQLQSHSYRERIKSVHEKFKQGNGNLPTTLNGRNSRHSGRMYGRAGAVLTVNERSGRALLATTLVGEDESWVGCQWLRRR